jgi:hypothetical protein
MKFSLIDFFNNSSISNTILNGLTLLSICTVWNTQELRWKELLCCCSTVQTPYSLYWIYPMMLPLDWFSSNS